MVSVVLTLVAMAASAQSTLHPTPAERAQHKAHAQHLKTRQQQHKLQQSLQRQINRTASQAYKKQPEVQKGMRHAASARQRQTDARNRDLDKKVERAQRPLPLHTEPAPTSSR